MTAPLFQHRHYEFIAREMVAPLGMSTGPLEAMKITLKERTSIAKFIGGQLSRDNPKFNMARFLRACGVEG